MDENTGSFECQGWDSAKQSSPIPSAAETDQEQWDAAEGDLPVRVRGQLADGTVVIEGTITLWVTSKKK